ncbi:MAG: DUF3426 domain-containing protein [Gammaproteobacteria bacterium]|nr:DUF3426 domain-containing protein [Gammaproteobacteria bacterium]
MEFVCPNCQQINEISGLPGTSGQFAVDCPYCHHGFTIQIDIQAIPDDEDVIYVEEPDVSEPEPENATDIQPQAEAEREKPTIEITEEVRLAALDHVPEMRQRSRAPARIFGSLVSIALLASLALQQAYFRRDELAGHERLRPWLEKLCRYAECTLAPRRAPDRLRISRPDVHLDEQYQNVLDASALIRNEAAFPQALPGLELSFYDLEHRRVAWRRFEPREYLGNLGDRVTVIPANGTLLAQVRILDPGTKAMGFEFTAR